jgi:predicted porin
VKKKLLSATFPIALLAATAAGFAGSAQAADDTSLTWNGITLYGVIDMGILYMNHGLPMTGDIPGGMTTIAKASNKSATVISPNGLSQSTIGLKGNIPLNDQFSAIFDLQLGFNPQSGKLTNGPGSLVQNNGVPLEQQKAAADSARAGQLFNGQAFAGINSKDLGTLMIGRLNTFTMDNVAKYDPMNGSYAFSVIGIQGATAGGGNTENTRLDNSVKYLYKFSPQQDLSIHVGAMYQFGKVDSNPGEAFQANAGVDYAGFSFDALVGKKKNAVAAAPLSVAQFQSGLYPSDSLAATLSDNSVWGIGASYRAGPVKVSGGYEHIKYQNPTSPIRTPFTGVGGYYFSIVNSNAYANAKKFDVTWLGVQYFITPKFDVTGAWYQYHQNAYGAVKCSNNSAPTCSGNLQAFSVRLDYRFNARFDVYTGAEWSKVQDGLASGYLSTSLVAPMVGFRFKF